MFSLSANERSVVEKIRKKYDLSDIEIIQEFIPYLKILTNSSRKHLKLISDWFELDATEKKILKTSSND